MYGRRLPAPRVGIDPARTTANLRSAPVSSAVACLICMASTITAYKQATHNTAGCASRLIATNSESFYSETLVAVPPAASGTAAGCLWTRCVDDNLPALNGFAVELLDGFFSISLRFHFYESKATLSACITICWDGDRDNFAGLCEQFFEASFVQAEGDVPHK